MITEINKDTLIEELVEVFPLAIPLLSKYGIRCLLCGEPTWGTVGSAAKEKFIDDQRLKQIIIEMNEAYNDYKNKKG